MPKHVTYAPLTLRITHLEHGYTISCHTHELIALSLWSYHDHQMVLLVFERAQVERPLGFGEYQNNNVVSEMTFSLKLLLFL